MKFFITSLMFYLMLCNNLFAQPNLFPPPIERGVPGKEKGDIIAPVIDSQIAAWCDFEKQIVVTRTNVLCVYNGKATEANT